jgi:hypothetical protein
MQQRSALQGRERIARGSLRSPLVGICRRWSPGRATQNIASTKLSPLQGSLLCRLSQGFASLTPGYFPPALRAWHSVFERPDEVLQQPLPVAPTISPLSKQFSHSLFSLRSFGNIFGRRIFGAAAADIIKCIRRLSGSIPKMSALAEIAGRQAADYAEFFP